ncbi:MAG: type II toxin-antitoxin system ParD family antitoxin [Rhizobium rhizophilum]
MPTRNINLSDHQDGLVRRLIDSGAFASASEVFRAGLRLLEVQEREDEVRLARLRAEVQKGIDSFHQGRFVEFTDETEMRAYFDQSRAAIEDQIKQGE